jgi:microfibrillar-associated protein 1
MTANPARPVARYRPGKAIQEEPSSEEDETDEETAKQPTTRKVQPKAGSFPARAQPRQVPAQRAQEESEDEEGFVTEEEDEGGAGGVSLLPVEKATSSTARAQSTAVARPAKTAEVNVKEDKSEESEDETSEEEEEEADSTSEEEAPQRKFQRPTFIKKSDRGKSIASATNATSTNGVLSTTHAPDTIAAEGARRKEMADLMIKDKLERDAAARAAGRKGWDDDDEVAPQDMVDDTDGLDPEAEYAAWKLRELKRLKRDREAIEQREKEIEEIERRRNLTQAEREADDREYIEQQKEEREEGRGKAGFLQRYHHKGAFFQDEETAEILRKRNLMGAKFADEVQNREALPQYMQIRDMTKLGKKGRTRYTDLKGEDTGRWGQGYDERERKGPKVDCGVDERFRPDHDGGGGAKGPTGANASIVRDRRDRKIEGAPEGSRAMRNSDKSRDDDRGDSHRPWRRINEEGDDGDDRVRQRSSSPKRRRSHSRSRSRSISRHRGNYRNDDGRSRRKRSPAPFTDRDKRRRVEAQ